LSEGSGDAREGFDRAIPERSGHGLPRSNTRRGAYADDPELRQAFLAMCGLQGA